MKRSSPVIFEFHLLPTMAQATKQPKIFQNPVKTPTQYEKKQWFFTESINNII